ncbi:MAG: hypothetical protein WCI71_13900 [Bacteroidota bacterium]
MSVSLILLAFLLFASAIGSVIASPISYLLSPIPFYIKTYLTWISRDGTNFDSKTFSIFGFGNYTHHDLFNFFIYIVIFLLFILWVEVFAKKYPK